jgi:hypothetical protein
MGLDMYLTGDRYKCNEYDDDYNEINIQYVDGFRLKSQRLELGYWRKHANLHGYIVNTFADGVDECQVIHMSVERLRQVAQALRDGDLPHTEGFFFGSDELREEYRKYYEEDAKVFDAAADWVENAPKGLWNSVEYQASW